MRSDSWGTPRWLFDLLDAEYRFDLDVCATGANALCDRWLENALGADRWPGDSAWFMNPPYRRDLLVPLLERACLEASDKRRGVVILPVRACTAWWHDLVIAKAEEIRFIQKRVAFVPPAGHDYGGSNRPGHATAIVVYGEHPKSGPRVSSVMGRPVRKRDYLPLERPVERGGGYSQGKLFDADQHASARSPPDLE